MASVNGLLDEIKSIIETGFTVNGVNYLGSELDLLNYKAATVPFTVHTERGALGEEKVGPVIIVHEFDAGYFRTVGKRSKEYAFNLDFIFTDSAFSKVVGADTLKGPKLARELGEHIALAIDLMKPQFTTSCVQTIEANPVPSETGRIEDTDLCGGRVNFTVRFR